MLYHLGKKDVFIDGNMEKSKEFIERLQMVHEIVPSQLEKGEGKKKRKARKASCR